MDLRKINYLLMAQFHQGGEVFGINEQGVSIKRLGFTFKLNKQ